MSYFYIINPEVGRGAYRKISTKLKQILLDLDIAGEFAVATPSDNFTDLAHLAIKRGYKNIIAVGGSETVNKVSLALIQAQKGIFGIIPIGKNNTFAKILGIDNWEYACQVLGARRINRIDAGAFGTHTFLTALEIAQTSAPINYYQSPKAIHFGGKKTWTNISADGKYLMEGNLSRIIVSNVSFGKLAKYSLFDGTLHLATDSAEKKFGIFGKKDNDGLTYLHAQKFSIETVEPLKIFLDGTQIGHTPCEIQVIPAALRMIVDRDRPEDSQ